MTSMGSQQSDAISDVLGWAQAQSPAWPSLFEPSPARPMLWALHGLGPGFIFLKPKAQAQAQAFNPYIEIPLIDIACGQIMRSNRIINIILYTWDITVIVPLMEFEYGLEKEIDRLQVYYHTGKNPKEESRIHCLTETKDFDFVRRTI